MMSKYHAIIISILSLAILGFASLPATCEDAPATTQVIETAKSVAPLSLGFEIYQGTSNFAGAHHLTDGMWAGSGPAYPSLTYLQWTGSNGDIIKTSMGVGNLYTDKDSVANQPIEAYWKKPLGKTTLTVGKYYIPFAQQEWLYVAQWGAMAEWSRGRASFNTSANYNKDWNRPNLYFRSAYQMAEDAEISLSLADGKGFCTDSSHGKGLALETNIGHNGWRFCSEYNYFTASDGSFNFLHGKLSYEKLGKFKPFAAKYWWKDDCGELGNFRSNVAGADYQMTPWLSVEGAVADTSDGTVSWLEVTTKCQTPLF